jgi:hypothetical protein
MNFRFEPTAPGILRCSPPDCSAVANGDTLIQATRIDFLKLPAGFAQSLYIVFVEMRNMAAGKFRGI